MCVFSGACVTNLVVFFLCYHSSNSLRLVVVQTCGKFGCKQTHLFRPTISTSMSCLVVSSAVSILCFRESFNFNYENTLFTTYRLVYCMGTNHLSFGYESSQHWVRIISALGTNHLNFGYKSSGYETSGKILPVFIFTHILAAVHFHFNLYREVKCRESDGTEPWRVSYAMFKTGKQQCARLKLPQTLVSVSETLKFIILSNISCFNFAK